MTEYLATNKQQTTTTTANDSQIYKKKKNRNLCVFGLDFVVGAGLFMCVTCVWWQQASDAEIATM